VGFHGGGDWALREIGALFSGMDYAAVAQRIKRMKQAAGSSARLKRVLVEYQNI
jgi:hypothetical protein